jgi:hypothetical protein
MTALLLAAVLTAAPGCPAALAQASAAADLDLAGEALALVRSLDAEGAGGPVDALRDAALDVTGPDRSAAGARFRAALVHHCDLAARPPLPAASAAQRARAAEILDQPAFRRARADPEALRRRLLSLWQRILALGETSEAQRYVSYSRALFLAAAAAAVAIGLLSLRRGRAVRRLAPAAPVQILPPAAEARIEDAEAAAARGEGSLAIRLALLAALASLEREGAVPAGRSFTNAELADHLRGAPPVRLGAFVALSRLFDRTVYGGRPAGPSEAAAALQAARALGSEVAP